MCLYLCRLWPLRCLCLRVRVSCGSLPWDAVEAYCFCAFFRARALDLLPKDAVEANSVFLQFVALGSLPWDVARAFCVSVRLLSLHWGAAEAYFSGL